MRKEKKILTYIIFLITSLGLSQCEIVQKSQERHSYGDWLCLSEKLRKRALIHSVLDTVSICIHDRVPRGSDSADLPKEYSDTISIYVDQILLYRGTSHDLYLPYVGQKIQCFRYANKKRKKIATIKIVNERLKKEKIAALILVEEHRNWYYCDYNWDNRNLYLGDPLYMEDSRCLLKYRNK